MEHALRGKAYETSCWTTLCKSCAEILQYNAECDYYSKVSMEPMNNVNAATNMPITQFLWLN